MVSRTEASSVGEIPALLNSTSIRPNLANAARTRDHLLLIGEFACERQLADRVLGRGRRPTTVAPSARTASTLESRSRRRRR